jgi:thioredoxin-like negative regulator of GroEL
VTFEREVLGASGPVLVHVAAGSCDQCLSAASSAGWAAKAGRTRCYCLDGKHCAALAARFGVTRFPTILLFRDGTVVRRLVGQPLPDCLELFLRMAR